jgi:hypothetical protein
MPFYRFFCISLSVASVASLILINLRSYAQFNLFNEDNLEPLTTTDLRGLAVQQGICSQGQTSVTFNRCVGLAFQRTVIEGVFKKKQNTQPKLSPVRDSLTRANSKRVVSSVIPDAIFDFTDEKTRRVYDEGGYTEVKAVNGTLRLRSSNFQIAGLLDIATRLKIVPLGGTPAVTFITTSDTEIGIDVITSAKAPNPTINPVKIALYQYKAYTDTNNRVCLTKPFRLGSERTYFKEDYTEVRCSKLLSGNPELPNDPDPATVE